MLVQDGHALARIVLLALRWCLFALLTMDMFIKMVDAQLAVRASPHALQIPDNIIDKATQAVSLAPQFYSCSVPVVSSPDLLIAHTTIDTHSCGDQTIVALAGDAVGDQVVVGPHALNADTVDAHAAGAHKSVEANTAEGADTAIDGTVHAHTKDVQSLRSNPLYFHISYIYIYIYILYIPTFMF